MPATKWRKPGPLTIAVQNPRHEVWIEDEEGIRKITAPEPGEQQMVVGGRTYVHTREVGSGEWVYTLTEGA